MQPETPDPQEVAGKIGSRYQQQQTYGDGMGVIGASSQFVGGGGAGGSGFGSAAGSDGGFGRSSDKNDGIGGFGREYGQRAEPQRQTDDQGLQELEGRIKQLQDRLDNDYTLSKPKAAELRRELQTLRVQRNGFK